MQILFCFSGHFLFTCIYKIITFTRINIAIASIEKENIELQIKKKFFRFSHNEYPPNVFIISFNFTPSIHFQNNFYFLSHPKNKL